MTVIGADAIERAAKAGEPVRLAAGDLVTPLARERARDLDVEIVSRAAPSRVEAGAAQLARPIDRRPVRTLRPARAAPRSLVIASRTSGRSKNRAAPRTW